MKIAFKKRHNSNPNDCWCDSISLAIHKPYDEVYKMFTPMMSKDGALNFGYTIGAICAKNGEYFEFDKSNERTIRQVITRYNTHDNDAIISIKGHQFYVSNNTVYDNVPVEERELWLSQMVECICLIEKNEILKEVNL